MKQIRVSSLEKFLFTGIRTVGLPVHRSGESRINNFLPEQSSICQYPPKISAINIKSNLHYLRKWFRQCNLSSLSSLNLTPHTIAYLLILYLQSTYPKIANLIQIFYIVCRALGCFKGGSCERFAIDVIQISTTRRTGFN